MFLFQIILILNHNSTLNTNIDCKIGCNVLPVKHKTTRSDHYFFYNYRDSIVLQDGRIVAFASSPYGYFLNVIVTTNIFGMTRL